MRAICELSISVVENVEEEDGSTKVIRAKNSSTTFAKLGVTSDLNVRNVQNSFLKS